ncbi:MAG TPA: baseplate J/gp47 family protein [Candidatus Limnocylindrales bacterium]|nr:baseplate J/gp47 family protein [Candidatus Limnocylindrales bacterium]
MPLQAPNLDDRSFEDLVSAARQRIVAASPEWTDLSPGDPGMTLVEVFAYLAETMIYRLNRVPEKLYVEFLRLIGVRLRPPAAASVTLTFSRDRNAPPGDIEIPRGTRVTTGAPPSGTEAPVFATTVHATLPAGEASIKVPALNAEQVTAELGGQATGRPGSWFSLARPPAIGPTGDPLDLLVAVETQPSELGEGDPAIESEGKTYQVWREVDNFSDLGPNDPVYVADRAEGVIVFAAAAEMSELAALSSTSDARNGNGRANGDVHGPRALAAVPRAGREVRFWYRRGGGTAGNVAAGTLTTMRDTISGLSVTNETPATGGREQESIDNALVRGPQELRSLARAVTARDYQLVAERSSGAVARARAFTQAALWRHATPGTVEVVIVPALPDPSGASGVSAAQLVELQSEEARQTVVRSIDERRPLGTQSVVTWARYKIVRIRATIIVRREEDLTAVRQRVNERLRLTVNPLHTDLSVGGWPFGQPLFASNVYKIVLSEPGVRYARGIRLLVDEVPDTQVEAIVADAFQPRTWYAGSGARLFRTLNDGDGWEQMAAFEGVLVNLIRVHPQRPGTVAAVSELEGGRGSRIYVSRDTGSTWDFTRQFGFVVEDVAWTLRDGEPMLLMATSGGLYQLPVDADADPVQLLVDPANQNLPFYAVVATQEVKGEITVAAAAQGFGGVFVSSDAGASGTFRAAGLEGEDVRVLTVQYDGPRSYLWAGTAAPGGPNQPGVGAFRRELLGREDPAQGWVPFRQGWTAGSCWALAFSGTTVFAATQQVGVMRLDLSASQPSWVPPTVDSGLPLRDPGNFHPVRTAAASPDGLRIMAGGPVGVFRTLDADAPPRQRPTAVVEPLYESASSSEFAEEVTLPPTWLFTCGENEIEVVSDAPE